jgi:hypothetical protein
MFSCEVVGKEEIKYLTESKAHLKNRDGSIAYKNLCVLKFLYLLMPRASLPTTVFF